MGKSQKNNKKKKTKVIYIDDGSSLADMSGVSRRSQASRDPGRYRSSFRDQWRTYTDAVKMMFLPMLAVLGIIAIAFLIVYIIL